MDERAVADGCHHGSQQMEMPVQSVGVGKMKVKSFVDTESLSGCGDLKDLEGLEARPGDMI